MGCGVLCISLPIPIIVNNFNKFYEKAKIEEEILEKNKKSSWEEAKREQLEAPTLSICENGGIPPLRGSQRWAASNNNGEQRRASERWVTSTRRARVHNSEKSPPNNTISIGS